MVADRMRDDEMALAPYAAPSALVRPLVTPSAMLEAIREYEALKAAIIQPTDIQVIGDKKHIKKSGWLRIARAFNLTVEPVSEQYITAEDGTWGYAIVVRAVAPNGASMQGDGMCWSTEKYGKQCTRHNVRAHAYTRASNRAISNLVGGGEVSAEEMGDYDEQPHYQQRPQPQQPRPAPRPLPQRPAPRPAARVVEAAPEPTFTVEDHSADAAPAVTMAQVKALADELGTPAASRKLLNETHGGDALAIYTALLNQKHDGDAAKVEHDLKALGVVHVRP